VRVCVCVEAACSKGCVFEHSSDIPRATRETPYHQAVCRDCAYTYVCVCVAQVTVGTCTLDRLSFT